MLVIRSEPPFVAREKAFTFQVDAVEAIKNLPYAAIFHEQGLGKTKIAIDLALTWISSKSLDSVLIVTKKSLVENWLQEIRTHSFLAPKVLGQDRRANFFCFNSPARIYLTHYEVCRSEEKRLKLFQKTRRLGVICDEAQKIKNPNSILTKVMFGLAPGFLKRVIMTGTPIANRPYDIWSLIWFLDQGRSLGSNFEEFRTDFDLSNALATDVQKEAGFRSRLGSLYTKIQSFTVRETKSSVDIELPQKEIHTVFTDFEPRQKEMYFAFRDDLRATIRRDGRELVDSAEDILKRLLRLVQVASNPSTIDESYRLIPGKFTALTRILQESQRAQTKAVVWSSFIENVDWLHRALREYNPVKLHGKMSIDVRNAAIERFKTDATCRVLIATPGAAKEGLTLTVASYAVFFDRSFSLDDYLQAQDRIHRISQTRPCHVFNLIMRDSVDEWVDMLLASKHVAAQLGQGDIDATEYDRKMSYDFAIMLKGVLGDE